MAKKAREMEDVTTMQEQPVETHVTRAEEADVMEDDAEEPSPEVGKALAPILRALPAEMQHHVRNLLAEMSPNQVGLEEMDARWTPPNVKVRQAVSTDMPQNVNLGELYTDDGQVLGKQFEFIPLYMYPTHLKFDQNESSPSCRSEDAKTSIYGDICKECPDEPFKNGQPTACNRYRNVFVFDAQLKRIYRIAFGKTGAKTGSKLQKYMKASGNEPWRRIYSLESVQKSRQTGQGTYYVLNVVATGKEISDDARLGVAKFFHEQIKTVRAAVLEAVRARMAAAGKAVGQPHGTATTASVPTDQSQVSEPDFSKSGV